MLPPALIYFALVLLPVIQAIYFSFFRWNGLGPLQGLHRPDNYVRILHDRVFLSALSNNLLLAVMSVVVQLPLALGLALLIRRNLRGRTLFRMIFFLPYVLSEVVTGVIWTFIYNPQSGLLNALLSVIPGLQAAGLAGRPADGALPAVRGHLLEILRAAPDPLYGGAAKHPGGTGGVGPDRRGQQRPGDPPHHHSPAGADTIRLSLFLSVLGSLQIFDLIWVMTTGGPVSASETMVTYLYQLRLPAVRHRLWQRGGSRVVRDLPRLRLDLPAPGDAARLYLSRAGEVL